MTKMICIKSNFDYKEGDVIEVDLYEDHLEHLISYACEEWFDLERKLLKELAKEGKDIINDFCGIELNPIVANKLYETVLQFEQSFISSAEWRERQINSVIQDDFESLFETKK